MRVNLKFASELADVRLLQTERLLEWMTENVGVELAEAVTVALGAVADARSALTGVRQANAS
jgi:ribosomal protein L7/L12